MPGIKDRINEVKKRIHSVAIRADRDPRDVILMAVSKTVDVARIREAMDAGVRDFGENYYQEAREKISQLGNEIHWHFIGALQTNKAKYVTGDFTLIHSIDSIHLAEEVHRRAIAKGIVQSVLVELKLDPSETKHGVSEKEFENLAERMLELEGLKLLGLMGMPPITCISEDARPYFQILKRLFDRLPETNRRILSMGMSADFETAIEEGSTLVRVGSAIFGPRKS